MSDPTWTCGKRPWALNTASGGRRRPSDLLDGPPPGVRNPAAIPNSVRYPHGQSTGRQDGGTRERCRTYGRHRRPQSPRAGHLRVRVSTLKANSSLPSWWKGTEDQWPILSRIVAILQSQLQRLSGIPFSARNHRKLETVARIPGYRIMPPSPCAESWWSEP